MDFTILSTNFIKSHKIWKNGIFFCISWPLEIKLERQLLDSFYLIFSEMAEQYIQSSHINMTTCQTWEPPPFAEQTTVRCALRESIRILKVFTGMFSYADFSAVASCIRLHSWGSIEQTTGRGGSTDTQLGLAG